MQWAIGDCDGLTLVACMSALPREAAAPPPGRKGCRPQRQPRDSEVGVDHRRGRLARPTPSGGLTRRQGPAGRSQATDSSASAQIRRGRVTIGSESDGCASHSHPTPSFSSRPVRRCLADHPNRAVDVRRSVALSHRRNRRRNQSVRSPSSSGRGRCCEERPSALELDVARPGAQAAAEAPLAWWA